MATKGVLALNTVVDDILDNAYPTFGAVNSVEYLAIGGGGAGGAAAGGGGGAGGFVTGTTLPITVAPFSYSGYFNGSSYLSMPGAVLTSSGSVTIEAWLYLTGSSLVGLFDGGAGQTNIIRNSPANVFGWQGNDGAGANVTGQYPFNKWFHFAVTYSAGSIKTYFDGKPGATGTYSSGTYTAGSTFNVGAINTGSGGYFNGHISNFRVTKSVLYTAAFIPPSGPLDEIANTSVLTLKTSLDDNSTNNHVITKVGLPKISNRSPFENPVIVNVGVGGVGSSAAVALGGNGGNTLVNSGWSGYFNGSTDYLTAPVSAALTFGSSTTVSAMTVEAWFYTATTASTDQTVVSQYASGSSGWSIRLLSGVIRAALTGDTTLITGTTTLASNTWYHVALSGSVGNWKLFLNGVQQGSTQTSSVTMGDGAAVQIGRLSNISYFNGFISGVRILKGTALYTANFTPPPAPLTAIPDTVLLTLQNSTFKDNSSNTKIITKSGSAYTTTLTSPFEIKAFGGGGGGSNQNNAAENGWASGGGNAGTGTAQSRGSSGIYGQGSPGGTRVNDSPLYGSGGGGGAGAIGGKGTGAGGGAGGNGLYSTITGSNVAYAGGGGGQSYNSYSGASEGGIGGGGASNISIGGAGGMYLGGGGGGGGGQDAVVSQGGYGGTGVVILRHPTAYDIVGRSANVIDVSYSSGYKIYTLRTTDTVYFSSRPTVNTPNVASVNCLVIGGGGAGGTTIGGGGGAGGFVAFEDYLIMRGNTVAVTVGAGGIVGGSTVAGNGGLSTFGDVIAAGGGGGANWANNDGAAGASGGGGSGRDGGFDNGGLGISGQGSRGGNGQAPRVGGGGGGAGQYGYHGSTTNAYWGGNGGNGLLSSITGTPTYYSGGGAGGVENTNTTHISTGGLGGGGDAGYTLAANAGIINSGGGGGAGSNNGGVGNNGGAGGSGVVIISYATKYGLATSTTGSPAITTVNGNYVYKWTTTGSITF